MQVETNTQEPTSNSSSGVVLQIECVEAPETAIPFRDTEPCNWTDAQPEAEDTNKQQQHDPEPEPKQEPEPHAKSEWEILIESIIVDPDAAIGEPPAVISVDHVPICTLGSFSLLIGKAKTRKTFLVAAITAAAISGECNIDAVTGSMPPGSEVHYFDTEQSKFHLSRTVKRIQAQAGSSNFIAYEMRPFTPKERLRIIEYVITHLTTTAFIVIDGLRDLMSRGINDEAEATEVISKLLKWTHIKDCHIMKWSLSVGQYL